jgi:hypothetical protein
VNFTHTFFASLVAVSAFVIYLAVWFSVVGFPMWVHLTDRKLPQWMRSWFFLVPVMVLWASFLLACNIILFRLVA